MSRLIFLFSICILSSVAPVAAQTDPTPSPSPNSGVSPADSVEIGYSADNVSYNAVDSTLILTGNAVVTYGDVTLKAGQILFNMHTDKLYAEDLADPTTDGAQPPTLEDPQGTLVGKRMQYDIRSGEGRILEGRTAYEQGFFEGQSIRVDSESTLRIDSGSYSTCDNPLHKHYSLRSGKIKIVPNDKAIVKDVVAYVYKVPVFYMPFYVLPLKRGRHSGFTVPTYGSGAAQGKYVRNIGYYWAASDYWDFKGSADFTGSQGMLLRPRFRYADARRLRGNVSGSYRSGYDLKTTGWDLRANHWQQLRPDLQVSGQAETANSLSFVNSTTRGIDPGRLQRALRSQLSVTKLWGQKSMDFSVRRVDRENVSSQNATLSFRLPSRPLAATTQRRRPSGGAPDMNSVPVPTNYSWLQSVLFGYSGRIEDQRQKTTSERTLLDQNLATYDSVRTVGSAHQTIFHQFNMSSQQKMAGWLKFQPQASYSETWGYARADTSILSGGGANTDTTAMFKTFDRSNAYSVGIQANTTFYGLFNPNIGGLQSIRHVVRPAFTFSQSGPRAASRSLSFSLRNIFQAKTLSGGQERKTDIMFSNLSTGYNFKATSRPLRDLTSSFRIPSRVVNFDAQLSHDFYQPTTNAFRFPWLERASINTTINLRGRGGEGMMPGFPANPSSAGLTSQNPLFPTDTGLNTTSYRDRYNEDFDRIKGPWSVALTHRYAVSRSSPSSPFLASSHIISASNRFSLERVTDVLGVSNRFTKKWRVEHAINYDFRRKEIVSQSFNLHRTLHCWEMFIRWTPNGFNQGIYFRLNIIAHPDIKLEQQRLTR